MTQQKTRSPYLWASAGQPCPAGGPGPAHVVLGGKEKVVTNFFLLHPPPAQAEPSPVVLDMRSCFPPQFAAAVAKSWQRAFCIIFDLLTHAAVLDSNTIGVSVWRNMVALPASSFHSLRKTSLLFSQILGQIKYTKITLETEKESLASNLALEQHMQPWLVSQVKSGGWKPGRVSSAGTAGSPWLLCKQIPPLFVVARMTTFVCFNVRLSSWEFTHYTLQLNNLKLSRNKRASRSWTMVA